MGKGTFYGLSMKTPVIYAKIQVLLMFSILDAHQQKGKIHLRNCVEYNIIQSLIILLIT